MSNEPHRLSNNPEGFTALIEAHLAYPLSTGLRAAVLLPIILGLPLLAEHAPVVLSHLRGL